ncbi:ABC transporter permease [Fodinicurvata sp. EGI_FJ10296]|uniref:ABC transporter permease n=1 Tax=Fodinicurvata sp. EGI_FJ10296 TaxID=3231908 RepID=UPI003455E2BC
MRKFVQLFLSRPEFSALIMIIVVLIGFSLYSPYFMTPTNIRVVLGIIPELGLVALGVSILMIAGEFDLSVGSVLALTPMVAFTTMAGGLDPTLAILLSLLVALGIGFINAQITLRFNIPSFITTLGMLFIARSLTVVISGGSPPPFPADAPAAIFVEPFALFRMSLIWYAGLAILLGLMLHMSNFGNWVFATGGYRPAARDMGIDVFKVKTACFMLCSFLAGFAGLIQAFRLRSALPSAGVGLELEAIAASVIGGMALTGGIGSVLGAVIGASLIRVIDNGLVMARVDANWFNLAIGTLTIVAVIFNTWIRERARRMRT